MKYLWLDMEMSGLDVEQCKILEVAAIVTNLELLPLQSYHSVVFQPPEVLAAMDAWCTETHGKSGLTAAVAKGAPLDRVEKELLALIDQHFAPTDRPILSGNSIGQDRKFIDAYMPRLAERLHYRMLDVSSFKIVFQDRFGLKYNKRDGHRALDDILESIGELSFYLTHVRAPETSPPSP